jgi:hypothetical protein
MKNVISFPSQCSAIYTALIKARNRLPSLFYLIKGFQRTQGVVFIRKENLCPAAGQTVSGSYHKRCPSSRVAYHSVVR